MKANELMVGDYVYNHRNWECPIVEIHKNSAVVIARHYGEEEFLLSDLRPIPITAEVLEKNGFKKNKTGQWVIEKKHSIGCGGQTCSNTNPLEYAVWWDEDRLGCISYLEKEGDMSLVGTTYVHQLQQMLRLFDLDKFIKIEL